MGKNKGGGAAKAEKPAKGADKGGKGAAKGGKGGKGAAAASDDGAGKTKGGKGKNKDTSGGSGYTKVKVRHILTEKHGQAMTALDRINDGENFAEVAKEMSQDKAKHGGDLGWQMRGQMVGAFQEAAFELPKGGMTYEPVKTAFGYHIILVEDKA
eukprot:gene5082-324_t